MTDDPLVTEESAPTEERTAKYPDANYPVGMASVMQPVQAENPIGDAIVENSGIPEE